MFIAGVLAFEEEVLVIEDDLTVYVLHEDPESLRATVDLIIPLKVRSDGQLNLKSAPEDENKSCDYLLAGVSRGKLSYMQWFLITTRPHSTAAASDQACARSEIN